MKNYLHDLNERQYAAICDEYLKYVEDGLPAADSPKKIGIIGGGMSGLVAGTLLKAAGHDVHIYEGKKICGGRVETYRDQFSGDLYIEAGAMRLPTDHRLLQAYIKKYNIETRPFFNRSVDPETASSPDPVELNQNYVYCNGVKMRRSEYLDGGVDDLNFQVQQNEKDKTAEELLATALNPLRSFIEANPKENWQKAIYKFGEYSLRHYLKEQTLYSEGAIELIGVITNHESRMMLDFIQSFLETSIINPDTRFVEIVGGSDILPKAFLPELEGNISYERILQRLEWDESGGKGAKLHLSNWYREDWFEEEVDEVILTIPFTSLRFVKTAPLFSHRKRQAIRELHYDAATKVMLEFSHRFWEDDDQIYGGGTVTDLPNRNVYYPASGFGNEGGGVVLASYCWADDARRWDSLQERERLALALDGLCEIHGEGIREFYVGGASKSWMQDPFALGEAAIFAPGQLALHQPHVGTQEGNVHFAGEHTSLKHAWIEGAIESGIRTALEVNGQSTLESTTWA